MAPPTFNCKVCGEFKDTATGRWTSHQPHIVTMLSALTYFHGYDLDFIKKIYPLFKIRRLICRDHYVDAASSIAAAIKAHTGSFHQCGINLNEATTEALLMKLLPPNVFASMKATAFEFDSTLPLTMWNVAHFVNDVLARHGLRGVDATIPDRTSAPRTSPRKRKRRVDEVKDEPLELKNVIVRQIEDDKSVYVSTPPDEKLEYSVTESPATSITDLLDNDSHKTVADVLKPYIDADEEVTAATEVDKEILDRYYSVQGHMLLKLFRFCPKCGYDLSFSNDSMVQFTAIGNAPIVQFICNKCSPDNAPIQRWDGQPARAKRL